MEGLNAKISFVDLVLFAGPRFCFSRVSATLWLNSVFYASRRIQTQTQV